MSARILPEEVMVKSSLESGLFHVMTGTTRVGVYVDRAQAWIVADRLKHDAVLRHAYATLAALDRLTELVGTDNLDDWFAALEQARALIAAIKEG